jgi:hypothetical protein
MTLAWLLFIAFVIVLLALDLGVFHRSAHVVGFREALGWSGVWLTLGLAFAGVVYVGYEHKVWARRSIPWTASSTTAPPPWASTSPATSWRSR